MQVSSRDDRNLGNFAEERQKQPDFCVFTSLQIAAQKNVSGKIMAKSHYMRLAT
jgi:hypothetical protein